MIPSQHYLPWKVSMTILHSIAISSTCLRLENRRRTRRLWWDDYTTVVPAIIDCLNIAMLWLRLRNKPLSREDRALFSYIGAAFFATINWWSRISLAMAVVRITPIWSKSRRLAIGMTIAFFCFWVALLVGMIATCAVHTQWQYSNSQILICGPASRVTIGNTVLDVIGDVALIAIPLHQLWDINLPANERLRVRLVFSASSITLIASIALCTVSYGGYVVGPGALIVWIMACQAEEAVGIITSNLLVLVCWYLGRVSNGQGDINAGDVHITPHWSRQEPVSEKSMPSISPAGLSLSALEGVQKADSLSSGHSGETGHDV